MAISKIKGGAINDDAISTAKIVDDAVTADKIVDSYTTSLQTNPEFSGTEAARMPVGTTAERANAQAGDLRFNSTISLMEYYDGTQWKAIDAPPTVTSVSPSSFDTAGDTITVTGTNFQSGLNIKVIDSDGTEYTPDSVTRVSSTSATFDITSQILSSDKDFFDVKITNTSGLGATLGNCLEILGTITFNEASGSLGTIYNGSRTGVSVDAGATDATGEGDLTFTYSISSGALPSGLSLNTSTGAITGDADAVGSDTTYNFTVAYSAADASSGETETGSRAFSLTVNAPVITSYTSTGSGTFSVPTGVTAVDVLVVAGGGAGGYDEGGGGGAGGLIYRPAFPVTPQGSVSYSVGAGGTIPNQSEPQGQGQNSTFGALTAIGGGGGGSKPYSPATAGHPGGSGGGISRDGGSTGSPGAGGTGTQPQQPGDSSTYGFGNPGGSSPTPSTQGWGSAGGGGGAGGAGGQGSAPAIATGQSPADAGPGGDGGSGKQYDISGSQVYYAGGGGGSVNSDGGAKARYAGAGAQGGGGNGADTGPSPYSPQTAQAGFANRGGGGGGGQPGGAGGSGIVIVKY
jgi:hypothetical protein